MKSKLVRDLIPERIRADGYVPICRIAVGESEQFDFELLKFYEEARELFNSPDPGEWADVCEIFDRLTLKFENKFGKQALLDECLKKRKENGGFDTSIILEGIEEP
jgi:predicted house-cleaning noncanonical NTP pyrophosphatase (MazG superfamily)